jgi:tetratricopeptide (TPR) repeat protein
MKKLSRKDQLLFENSNQLIRKKKFSDARIILIKLLSIYPNHYGLLNSLSMLLIYVGEYSSSAEIMKKQLNIQPKNGILLSNYGSLLIRLGALSKAEEVLRTAVQLDESNLDAALNLIGILNTTDRYKESLGLINKQLAINPLSARVLSVFGAILIKIGDIQSAKIACETAITLDNKLIEPKINLAGIFASEGNGLASIELYESVCEVRNSGDPNSGIIDAAEFSLSIELLKISDLSNGWEKYEYGFSQNIPKEYSRAPKRSFPVSKWNGDFHPNKKLLIWGEQGVADEIIFMTCINDAKILFGGAVIIECQSRMVETVRRSFPDCTVRASLFDDAIGKNPLIIDYDFHIPVGSLMKFTRKSLKDFENKGPYIIVDTLKAQDFENRLIQLPRNNKRIGICWRGGVLNPERNIHYTNIIDWEGILLTPNCDFINLQYGDCELELREVENKFGVKIHRWQDLDLKNDFDSTYSLISRLDLVITVGVSVYAMSAAVGVPVLLLQKPDTINLGTEYVPYFPNIRCIFARGNDTVAVCLSQAQKVLLDFISE